MAMTTQTTPVTSYPHPPGPRGSSAIFGSLLDIWADPLGLMATGVEEWGEIMRFRFAHLHYVVVSDPEAARQILVQNHRRYVKSRNYRGLKMMLGEGLLTSEGETWRKQRRLAQPAFHRERLSGFVSTMAECTRDMLARWDREQDGQTPFDAHAEMMRLTFRVVGRTLLSAELDGDAKATGEALTVALKWANDYVEKPVRPPPWFPTPANLRFARAKRTIDDVVTRVMQERRAGEGRHDDLLGMLMEARDEQTGEGMPDRLLRDELVTLVLAGHETTANALTFALYLLSTHPEVLRTLEREVGEVLGGRAPTLADLPRLTYTTQVLEETLRLYPPAWVMERELLEDDVIGGYRIAKGSIVAVAPFLLHRLPRIWPNPEGFDPTRFSREAKEARPKHAYLPFGGGPRTCIGNAFAMMEMQVALPMIVQRYRLELVPAFRLELDPSITLRPKRGVRMRPRRADRALPP